MLTLEDDIRTEKMDKEPSNSLTILQKFTGYPGRLHRLSFPVEILNFDN
jgi:hypothetical protein